MEQKTIFRKKSIDRINSPETLNEYLKVAGPSLWIILGAIILLLVGACIWSAVSWLNTTIPIVVISDGNETVGFMQEVDAPKLSADMKVDVDGMTVSFTRSSQESVKAGNIFTDSQLHTAGVSPEDWLIPLSADCTLPKGTYICDIVSNSVHPSSFIFN